MRRWLIYEIRKEALIKAARTIIAGIIAIALVPACFLAFAIGMRMGAPEVGLRDYLAFALLGLTGPASLFSAMLQVWPWSGDGLAPVSAHKISITVIISALSYLGAWAVVNS